MATIVYCGHLDIKLKCSHCSKTFKYESERKRHEESHSPHFECGVCSKKFSFLSALRRHEKQHDRKSSVYCDCGKKFRDETLLKRHVSYAHKGTYNCKKCSASFNSDMALQTHMKTHKPESERKFKCTHEGCEKTFNFSHHLKHHILTHTNAKQHYCNVCNKGFIQLHHLKAHLNTHNPDSWLHCVEPNCKKKFTTEYARKRHLLTHKVKRERENSSKPNSIVDESSSSNSMTDIAFNQTSSNSLEEIKTEGDTKLSEGIPEQNPLISVLRNEVPLISKQSLIKFENNVSESYTSDITDCKTVLGGCLMNAETDNKNCLCAQMSECAEEPYDLTVTGDKNERVVINNVFTCASDRTNCDDCECASVCGVAKNNSKLDRKDFNNFDAPKIEIEENGAIKIKDTFDIDYGRGLVKSEVNSHDEDSIPFNSCKAVLGKCIVSGNGTIGDGCLCKKMNIDEQTVTAQEIEDIIPHPNDPKLRSIVI